MTYILWMMMWRWWGIFQVCQLPLLSPTWISYKFVNIFYPDNGYFQIYMRNLIKYLNLKCYRIILFIKQNINLYFYAQTIDNTFCLQTKLKHIFYMRWRAIRWIWIYFCLFIIFFVKNCFDEKFCIFQQQSSLLRCSLDSNILINTCWLFYFDQEKRDFPWFFV